MGTDCRIIAKEKDKERYYTKYLDRLYNFGVLNANLNFNKALRTDQKISVEEVTEWCLKRLKSIYLFALSEEFDEKDSNFKIDTVVERVTDVYKFCIQMRNKNIEWIGIFADTECGGIYDHVMFDTLKENVIEIE